MKMLSGLVEINTIVLWAENNLQVHKLVQLWVKS